jgi:hypothetical protein
LPINNFTEEVKEDETKKRGKVKEKGKELGVITNFNSASEGNEKNKGISNGSYVYLPNKN